MCVLQKNFEPMVVMGSTKSLSLDSGVQKKKKRVLMLPDFFPQIQELKGGKGSQEKKRKMRKDRGKREEGKRKSKERERQDRGRGQQRERRVKEQNIQEYLEQILEKI